MTCCHERSALPHGSGCDTTTRAFRPFVHWQPPIQWHLTRCTYSVRYKYLHGLDYGVIDLIGQGQGVENIELTDPSIRDFERIARKYGVDYAVKRDRSSDPPKFLIFFKGRDNDAITAAFQEYAGKKVRKASRPSVLQKLAVLKGMVRDSAEKVKKKVLER